MWRETKWGWVEVENKDDDLVASWSHNEECDGNNNKFSWHLHSIEETCLRSTHSTRVLGTLTIMYTILENLLFMSLDEYNYYGIKGHYKKLFLIIRQWMRMW